MDTVCHSQQPETSRGFAIVRGEGSGISPEAGDSHSFQVDAQKRGVKGSVNLGNLSTNSFLKPNPTTVTATCDLTET